MKLNTPVADGQAVTVSHEPSSPLGLTAKVAPSWGGQARGGAEALWGNQIAYGMGSHQMYGSGERVDAEVGYGLPVGARFAGTPRRCWLSRGTLERVSRGFTLGGRRARGVEPRPRTAEFSGVPAKHHAPGRRVHGDERHERQRAERRAGGEGGEPALKDRRAAVLERRPDDRAGGRSGFDGVGSSAGKPRLGDGGRPVGVTVADARV